MYRWVIAAEVLRAASPTAPASVTTRRFNEARGGATELEFQDGHSNRQLSTAIHPLTSRNSLLAREVGPAPQRYDLLLMVEAAGMTGVRVTDLSDLLQMKQTTGQARR